MTGAKRDSQSGSLTWQKRGEMGRGGLRLLTGVDGYSNDKGCRVSSLSVVRLVEGCTQTKTTGSSTRTVGKNNFKIT